jgi:hypothetical protein
MEGIEVNREDNIDGKVMESSEVGLIAHAFEIYKLNWSFLFAKFYYIVRVFVSSKV